MSIFTSEKQKWVGLWYDAHSFASEHFLNSQASLCLVLVSILSHTYSCWLQSFLPYSTQGTSCPTALSTCPALQHSGHILPYSTQHMSCPTAQHMSCPTALRAHPALQHSGHILPYSTAHVLPYSTQHMSCPTALSTYTALQHPGYILPEGAHSTQDTCASGHILPTAPRAHPAYSTQHSSCPQHPGHIVPEGANNTQHTSCLQLPEPILPTAPRAHPA